ncbi:uncharacterized protein [Apostichopus japonicus]|uniref:uncharacterized protein isoform X1 n=1 Tax=Stichopus japonicus TaxID=307972 RepID=UPI003AB5EAD9
MVHNFPPSSPSFKVCSVIGSMARNQSNFEHWIDLPQQQSFLQNAPWKELYNVLCKALARLIHQDFDSFSSSQKSSLFDLLGRTFFERHMDTCKIVFDTQLKSDGESAREMKNYLKTKLTEALEDSHLDKNSRESKILKDFKDFLRSLLEKSLNETLQRRGTTDQCSYEQQERSESRDGWLGRETFSQEMTKSNVLGEAVAHILDRRPNMFETVCTKLKGHQLSPALRRKIWLWVIVSEKKKIKNWSYSTLEEEFHGNLLRRKAQMNINSVSSAPANSLIQQMVKEKFKSTPCLRSLANSDVESVIEEAMNIHDVCYGHSEPISVLLLFPLYIGLVKPSDDDIPLSLTISLNLLQIHLIHTRERSERIITNVLDQLQVTDEPLYQHMKDCAEINSMQELIKTKDESFNQTSGSDTLSVLLSTWIEKVFVNVLSRPAVMFVWDQLFLSSWASGVFEDICLCLILLLRQKLLEETKDYQTLMKVLLDEPSILFTADIQRAYNHVIQENDLSDVPALNRQVKKRLDRAVQLPSPSETPVNELPIVPVITEEPEPVVTSPSPEEGFDLYIDGIVTLPDHATITKVTGRVLTPTLTMPDLLAPPDLDCDAKCPTYTYRYTSQQLQKTNLIILRVYTVNALTREVVVVGSCAWNLYRDINTTQPKLKVGAFKLILRQGLPDNKLSPIEEDFHKLPKVPGCWLLFRVLPRSETIVDRPPFKLSSYTALNKSEHTTVKESEEIHEGPKRRTEREVALTLRTEEAGLDDDPANPELTAWILKRLEWKASLLNRKPKQMHPTHFFRYDPEIGLKVKVQGAWGLKGKNMYHGVMISLVEGMKSQSERNGPAVTDTRVLVATSQLDSLVSAPKWIDQPKVLHPMQDENSCLLLEVLGVTVERPPAGGKAWNRPFKMETISNLGWTVVPLFRQSSLFQGAHFLPLFQETKEKPFLTKLLTEESSKVIEENLKKKSILEFKDHPSVAVELFDGHFEYQDVLPLPVHTDLMKVTGHFKQYQKVAKESYGSSMVSSILIGQELVNSEEEKETLQNAAKRAFCQKVNTALIRHGLKPLTDDK